MIACGYIGPGDTCTFGVGHAVRHSWDTSRAVAESGQSDRIPRTPWDDVNAVLDDHAINFRFREPRSWDALRRAIIEAEAAAPPEPPESDRIPRTVLDSFRSAFYRRFASWDGECEHGFGPPATLCPNPSSQCDDKAFAEAWAALEEAAASPEPPRSIEAMAAEQGIGPITDATDLRIDLTDEEAAAFSRAIAPEPPLDVERLARAFIAQRSYVTYPSGWRDSDLRWLARQVAAEYARLDGSAPDRQEANRG